jgi:hypothetical protein
VTDDNKLTAAGGWTVPAHLMTEQMAKTIHIPHLTIPNVQVQRGGIRFDYVERSPTEQQALKALQAQLHRQMVTLHKRQNAAIDQACVEALLIRGDVDIERVMMPPRTWDQFEYGPYPFIGIGVTERHGERPIPTIREAQVSPYDDAYVWDEEEWD